MSEKLNSKLPVWFWVVAGFALVWNIIGVGSYISTVTMSEETLAAMPEAERALMEGFPSWALSAFAIAVFAGVAGCVLLLLRKQLATPVFGLSLAAIVVQMGWWVFLAGSLAVYGIGAAFMPALVTIVAAFLLWFSMSSSSKGWLN
ncbi:hypothetical protein PUV54_10650 [Hyphococcus flavus]|uniref:Sugar transporter n=1 Tax=Hyphococcus flavus TaxID=1866326 RepID=A0AAF0CG82_9PROT|nr:hypothetical protein [Hyphococcus flavus]WDI30417.1 hypothetical protein PUV54_10650 [Hyphococcus flavus]